MAEVTSAARNNAEWCDIVCRTHGIGGLFQARFWASPTRTPPFYPDAVTLDPGATAETILRIVDVETPGCSVKDSFANLDLSRAGFRTLFESEWITRDPRRPVRAGGGAAWRRVLDSAALEAWEAAWSGEPAATALFKPALLDDPAVSVLGGYVGDRLAAGAIVNRSRAVVGVSNVFTTIGDLGEAWSGCIATVAREFPRLPTVGYESGEGLMAAHANGFSSIGHLRVWIKEDQ